MTQKQTSDVLVGEVASALNECAGLLCAPSIDEDDGVVTLTVRIDPIGQPTLGGACEVLELFNSLRRVVDAGTLRGLAKHYGIDPSRTEALLDGGDDQDAGS